MKLLTLNILTENEQEFRTVYDSALDQIRSISEMDVRLISIHNRK